MHTRGDRTYGSSEPGLPNGISGTAQPEQRRLFGPFSGSDDEILLLSGDISALFLFLRLQPRRELSQQT